MWKEVTAVSFAAIVVAIVLYPSFSQLVPAVEGPVTSDPGLSTNSTNSTDSGVQTTTTENPYLTQSTRGPASTSQSQFDSAWIAQFFSIINVDRGGSTLAPCTHLDSFAALRFQTLNTGNNWEIVHYGYSVDLQHTYGGTAGSYAEEYFYPVTPSYRSPTSFAALVNPLYRYYGVYTGPGPILLFPHNCAPSEFSAGVNQTQVVSGCSYQKVSGPWLMVELADTCV
jgi:hypothetical protein